jgi:O-antigen/teichoic acid export membrane protein
MLQRLFRALRALVFGHLVARIGSLIMVPIFLSRWTASVYGEYLALFAVVSYFSGLDIGVQLAAVNRLTKNYACQEFEDYRSCQSSALTLYLVVALSVFVFLSVAAILLPIPQWIGLRHTSPTVARAVILVLGAYVLGSLPQRLITAVYQTAGNLARAQWISNIQQIASLIVSALLLLSGRGMISMAAAQVAVLTCGCCYVLWDRRQRFPELAISLSGARLQTLRQLIHPSLLFAGLMAGNLVAFQGNLLIVSAALGGTAVAVLSVSRTLVNAVREALYSINVSLWPDLARMSALDQLEKLRKVHRLSVFSTAALGLAAAATVWFEGADIVSIWTRGRLQPSEFLIRAFAVFVAMQTPWAASSAITTATNRHKTYAICYFLATVISVITTAVLVHRIGAAAVPVGLVLGEAICCYHFVVRGTCRVINENYRRFALRLWLGLVSVAVMVFAATALVHSMITNATLLRSTLTGATSLLTSIVCGALVWLRPQERGELFADLLMLLPWKSSREPAVSVGFD